MFSFDLFRALTKRRTVTVQRPGPNLAADIPTILPSLFLVCYCWSSGVVLLFIIPGDTVLLVPLFQFLSCQRASDSPYLDPRAPPLHRAAHHYHCPLDPTRFCSPFLFFAVFLSLAHCPDRSLFRGRLLLSF